MNFRTRIARRKSWCACSAGTRKNVCVVGDEDQSIYGWRGARAGNLKRFTEDFTGAKIIRLEENYRSTQTILDAAAAVVKNNSDRLGKNLKATLGAGDRLRFFEAPDSVAEAEFICEELSRRRAQRLRRPRRASSIAPELNPARLKRSCGDSVFATAWSADSAFTSAPKFATRWPMCA